MRRFGSFRGLPSFGRGTVAAPRSPARLPPPPALSAFQLATASHAAGLAAEALTEGRVQANREVLEDKLFECITRRFSAHLRKTPSRSFEFRVDENPAERSSVVEGADAAVLWEPVPVHPTVTHPSTRLLLEDFPVKERFLVGVDGEVVRVVVQRLVDEGFIAGSSSHKAVRSWWKRWFIIRVCMRGPPCAQQ